MARQEGDSALCSSLQWEILLYNSMRCASWRRLRHKWRDLRLAARRAITGAGCATGPRTGPRKASRKSDPCAHSSRGLQHTLG